MLPHRFGLPIVSIACVALLLNIARHGTRNYVDRHTCQIKDRIREA